MSILDDLDILDKNLTIDGYKSILSSIPKEQTPAYIKAWTDILHELLFESDTQNYELIGNILILYKTVDVSYKYNTITSTAEELFLYSEPLFYMIPFVPEDARMRYIDGVISRMVDFSTHEWFSEFYENDNKLHFSEYDFKRMIYVIFDVPYDNYLKGDLFKTKYTICSLQTGLPDKVNIESKYKDYYDMIKCYIRENGYTLN
jgi:hypothetical protein